MKTENDRVDVLLIQRTLGSECPENGIEIQIPLSQRTYSVHVDQISNFEETWKESGKQYDLIVLGLASYQEEGKSLFQKILSMSNLPVVVSLPPQEMHQAEYFIKSGAYGFVVAKNDGRLWAPALQSCLRQLLLEQRFEQKKRALDSLVDQNPDGLLILDRNNHVRFFNRRARSLFDGKLRLEQYLDIPLKNTSQNELSISRSDGSDSCVEIRVQDISWEGEHCLLLALHDVTSRNSKIRLNEMEARISNVDPGLGLEGFISQVVEELAMNTKSPIAWCQLFKSDANQEIWGWSKNLPDSLQSSSSRHFFRMEINEIFENPIFYESLSGGLRRPSKDWNPKRGLLKKWIMAPIRIKGNLVALVGVANKMKLYSKRDEALVQWFSDHLWEHLQVRIEAEIRFQMHTAIEQARETIMITDGSGRITYVNQAFETQTGCTKHEVMGQTPETLLDLNILPVFFETLNMAIKTKSRWNGDIETNNQSGRKVYLEITVSPLVSISDKITNHVIFVRDITQAKLLSKEKEQIQLQMQQRQKLESIGLLAGGVAHDFNNMLTVIIGYAEELLQRGSPVDPFRDSIQEILTAGNRSADLTRQLLAFSRKQTLEPTVLNLNQTIQQIHKMLVRLIGEQILFETDLDQDLWPVFVDPTQMEQVIMNIIVNARDAMPEGGIICIKSENCELDSEFVSRHYGSRIGPFVRLSITDTGCGMDQDMLTRIFDPFFTTKVSGKGTGLGLSTVYGIVKQSSGNIWVKSQKGHGTTFDIYLPKCTQTTVNQEEEVLIPDLSSLEGISILVVEDEPILRRMIVSELARFGFQVQEASNGGDALMLLERSTSYPDLILSDVIMPLLKGDELYRRLKESGNTSQFLFMSGYTETDLGDYDLLSPGVPFIKKPFTISKLLQKIQQVLAKTGP